MNEEIKEGTGLIHIYCGDGKGKTTAAVGLCIRAAGYGLKVLICQFMKDGSSSERRILSQIPGIMLLPAPEKELFSFQMDPEQRMQKKQRFEQTLNDAFRMAKEEHCQVLLLDEVLYAVGADLLEEDLLARLLQEKPEDLEGILTGRDPGRQILDLADYVSRISKVKHPFDRGIRARYGIER